MNREYCECVERVGPHVLRKLIIILNLAVIFLISFINLTPENWCEVIEENVVIKVQLFLNSSSKYLLVFIPARKYLG